MVEKRKCIYCGTTENLSDSDIIPDALTAARILNKCVCKENHNSKMTEKFEGEVAEKLAFLTNTLNIKSSKSKHYSAYPADYKIEGIKYRAKKIIRDNDFVNGKVLWDSSHTFGFGSPDLIEKIAKSKHEADIVLADVDLNDKEIEKHVNVNLDIFFNIAMFRQVAKIAFEWYCLKNSVDDFNAIFNEIITFILDGANNNIVTMVTDKNVLEKFSGFCDNGSHALFGYIDKDGGISVIVDMFGVALYNVKVCNTIPPFCKNNCLLQKINVDGSGNRDFEALCLGDYNDIISDMLNKATNIENLSSVNVQGITIQPQMADEKAVFNLFILNLIDEIGKGIEGTKEVTPEVFDFVCHQIEMLLQCSVLHKRGINRFIEENITTKDIVLNPQGTDKKSVFLYYILFIIGVSENQLITKEIFEEIYLKTFGIKDCVITDEKMNSMLLEMLSDLNYSEYIKLGAQKIQTWK